MDSLKQKRQLAAIMFTDIVGYTALMGDDEDQAFELLRNNRKLHKAIISEYNGRFLKEMGDGILSSFPTVSDAVYCSLAIQRQVKEDGEYLLRIGIHSGEVVFENEDVFGDGVNIASRIADNAREGHILVSETVYREIGNKKGIYSRLLEKTKLKNIKGPLNIYWIRDDSEEILTKKDGNGVFSFKRELKKRDVPRVLIAYIATALLIIQVARIAFPVLSFTEKAFQWLLILLVIGFPVIFILAWMYEQSPSGLIRTTSINSQSNPYSARQKKPLSGNWVISALLLVVALLYINPMNQNYSLRKLLGLANKGSENKDYNHLDQFTFNDKLTSSPSWSPDGDWVVYSSNESGSNDIWKTRFPGGEAIRLTSSPFPDRSPAWAPDNKSIIFERGGALRGLYQISTTEGGRATKIINFGSNPSWSPDGVKIVFDWHGSLFTYDFVTEVTETVVGALSNPPFAKWMPDNDRLIYWNSVVGKLFVISTSTKEKKALEIIPSGENVNGLSISRDGSKLIYSRGAYGGIKSLWEVNIDYKSGQVISSAKSIRLSITEDIECALSPDGTKMAFTARNVDRQLYRIPLDKHSGLKTGEREQLTFRGRLNYYPFVPQNGNKLIMTSHIGGNGLLYRMDLETGMIEKVTNEWGDSTREVEASMGKSGYPVFYSSTVNNKYEIFKQESKGSFPIRLNKPDTSRNMVAPALSPDEENIVYYLTQGGSFNIGRMGVNKGDPEVILTDSRSNQTRPVWSPDGQEIAYLSDESGDDKIWKMNADGSNQHEFELPAALEHGWCDWSPDGKWFYYAARVYDVFNIYKVNADYNVHNDGSSWTPITTFQSADFGLPDDSGFTKFEITSNYLIVPLEKRSGEIYILH